MAMVALFAAVVAVFVFIASTTNYLRHCSDRRSRQRPWRPARRSPRPPSPASARAASHARPGGGRQGIAGEAADAVVARAGIIGLAVARALVIGDGPCIPLGARLPAAMARGQARARAPSPARPSCGLPQRRLVAAASLRGAGRQGGFEGGADLGAAGVPTPLLLRLVEHAGLLCPSLLFGRGWSMRAPPPSLPPAVLCSSAPLSLR